ncbi:MAG: aminotransferase class V-fold PLP-dependent enzyme [Verrucomicrobia bacterium]|nr:aminotransferase class V-fold PLP-dependent enzyme [Verrucomicrobiota bacterium]
MNLLSQLVDNEEKRKIAFPICRNKIFMAHAAVTALPRVVADAIIQFTEESAANFENLSALLPFIQEARASAANLIGSSPDEIALIGPTSLGLSLFANGIDWRPGDEVICYLDDYPANVYPWLNLQSRGVTVRLLQPGEPGALTPQLIGEALTPKTRLVALASCHFFSGYRIDLKAIGKLLRENEVLFSVDAIQSLGAFPTTVEYVDFLSADAHKWMLGPLAIGIVYVRKECFDLCRPTLLGSRNVKAPGFIAQEEIEFLPTAQRYEPGAMNVMGIFGMKAAIDLLLEIGIANVAERILTLTGRLADGLKGLGFTFSGPTRGLNASGILTAARAGIDMEALFQRLAEANIVCSSRQDRHGKRYIRFSPHFYNTEAEVDQVLTVMAKQVSWF